MRSILKVIKILLLSILIVIVLAVLWVFLLAWYLDYHPGPDSYSTHHCEEMYLTAYPDSDSLGYFSGLLVCHNFNIDCWSDSFALKVFYRYIDSGQRPIYDNMYIEILDDKLFRDYPEWYQDANHFHFSTISLQFFADRRVKAPAKIPIWILIDCNDNKYKKYRHFNEDDPDFANVYEHQPRYLLPDSLYYLYHREE